MMRLSVLFFVLSILAFPQLASADTIDRVAAIVGDEIITFQDIRVDGRIQVASAGGDIEMLDKMPNRAQQLELLLKQMVQTQLLVREADKMRAPVTDAQVDERLAMIYEQSGQTEANYRALMAQEGISWTALRSFIRSQLKAQFVVRSELGGQVSVSDADVELCARERVPEGDQVTYSTLRQILVAAEPQSEELGKTPMGKALYPVWWDAVDRTRYAAARALYDRVNAGEDFINVAAAFSAGGSAERGGLLGEYGPGDLSADFEPVFSLREGEISDIVETSAGFHILYVESQRKGPNTRWVKALKECRGDLIKVETAKLIDGWISTLSEKSFVELKLMDDISGNQAE